MINIRQKGAGGEREVINILEPIVQRVAKEHGYNLNGPCIQRNQNQTAVGGADLSNTFGLAIEIKRQEALAVNTWWKQCTEQAKRNNEIPVLIYRQNGKKWRVVMHGEVRLFDFVRGNAGAGEQFISLRVEISWEDFLLWFEIYVQKKMALGEVART